MTLHTLENLLLNSIPLDALNLILKLVRRLLFRQRFSALETSTKDINLHGYSLIKIVHVIEHILKPEFALFTSQNCS